MNTGDLVKITDKVNRDLWATGLVIQPEDDYRWAVVETAFETHCLIDGDCYDIEVIRRVEPEIIGSVITDKNKVRWTKFTDNNRYDCQWISEYALTDAWRNIA
jgi:hypothetical protein